MSRPRESSVFQYRGSNALICNREKMYKDRFRLWGLRKNIKKDHVVAMLRKSNQRQQHGKRTLFKIHGKIYSLQTLDTYWKRQIELFKKEFAEDSPPTPSDLSCMTPPPVPIDIPDDLSHQHRLLRNVRDYCLGKFDAGAWVDDGHYVSQPAARSTTCDYVDLVDNVRSAWTFARIGDGDKVRKAAQRATVLIQTLISHEDPWFFVALLECANDVKLLGNTMFERDKVSEYFTSVAQAIRRKYDENHPLHVMSYYLPDVNTIGNELFLRTYECLVDSLLENVSLESHTRVWTVSGLNLSRARQRDRSALTAQRNMTQLCEQVHGNEHYMTFIARATLANCFHTLEYNQEAEQEQLRAVVEVQLPNEAIRVAAYLRELRTLARYHAISGHVELAEKNYREAYIHSSAVFGEADYKTLRSLADLVLFLRDRGKINEADELKEQLKEAFEKWQRAREEETSRASITSRYTKVEPWLVRNSTQLGRDGKPGIFMNLALSFRTGRPEMELEEVLGARSCDVVDRYVNSINNAVGRLYEIM